MNAQLKRGLLEACVLSVLINKDSYGYDLMKEIKPYVEISESTLYPILKRLEAGKMLEVYSVEHNSRIRKYYKITDLGIKKRLTFIEEWSKVMAIYEFILRGGKEENEKN